MWLEMRKMMKCVYTHQHIFVNIIVSFPNSALYCISIPQGNIITLKSVTGAKANTPPYTTEISIKPLLHSTDMKLMGYGKTSLYTIGICQLTII